MEVTNFLNKKVYADPECNVQKHADANGFKTLFVTTIAMANKNGFRLKSPKEIGFHQHGVKFPLDDGRSFTVFNIEQFALTDEQKKVYLDPFMPKEEPKIEPVKTENLSIKEVAEIVKNNLKYFHVNTEMNGLYPAFNSVNVSEMNQKIVLNFDSDYFAYEDTIGSQAYAECENDYADELKMARYADTYFSNEGSMEAASIALDKMSDIKDIIYKAKDANDIKKLKKDELIKLILDIAEISDAVNL